MTFVHYLKLYDLDKQASQQSQKESVEGKNQKKNEKKKYIWCGGRNKLSSKRNLERFYFILGWDITFYSLL